MSAHLQERDFDGMSHVASRALIDWPFVALNRQSMGLRADRSAPKVALPHVSDSASNLPENVPASDGLDATILHVLMDTIPDQIYFKDRQSRFVRNNNAHARALGAKSPVDCIGKTDFDFFSSLHAGDALRDEQEILRTGRPIVAKIEHNTFPDGSFAWVSTTKMPWRDAAGKIIGTFGLTRDITATKIAEDKLDAERKLLRTIIDQLPSRIFVKDAAGRYVLNNRTHLLTLGATEQSQVTGHMPFDFLPENRAQQAVADDRQVLAGGAPILNAEKSNLVVGNDTRWALTTKIPLRDLHDKITGLVGISLDITDRKRTEQELQRRTAEMEADLQMACQIQESFFPREYPVFPRGVPDEASQLRFAHRYLPAATLGGDFFDVIPLSDTQCGVLVCDVMGHGVRAGLLTALIRGVVEEFAPRVTDPALVLAEINRGLMPIIQQTGQPVFATAFYAVIDTITATVHYANAGHPPPLILRRTEDLIISLGWANPEPAAGLMESFVYSSRSVPFEPGDTLLAYTDGFMEASDATGAMFGKIRLAAFLREHAALTGRPLIDRLVEKIVTFTGRRDFDDDLCAVTVHSTGQTCTLQLGFNYTI
ncbi:MAG TPA: SpoIIE family protein phosphatase [Lacunisphaera sp.]|jgi:sigma-B regulation protein RsbU (phosphoserine phosphatase)